MKSTPTDGKYGYITPKGVPHYFHLQNCGFEHRTIFSSQEDYDRFEAYLYLLNSTESPRVANFFAGNRQHEIFSTARGDRLVAIGAYSFTAKEFHILAVPLVPKGISKFMQKLQTAYTMYFNKKYQRAGRLFYTSYRCEDITAEKDLHRIFSHIHLLPAELFDTSWDETRGSEFLSLAAKALQYRYSSGGEYVSKKFVISDPSQFPKYLLRARDANFYRRIWERLHK